MGMEKKADETMQELVCHVKNFGFHSKNIQQPFYKYLLPVYDRPSFGYLQICVSRDNKYVNDVICLQVKNNMQM